MSAIPGDHVVTRSEVYSGTLAGELVLFGLADRRLHVLNPTAAAVWSALESSPTFDELVSVVAEQYQVRPDDIADDVSRLIETLVREGCVSDPSTIVDHPAKAVDPDSPSSPGGPLELATAAAVGEPLLLRALGVPVLVETDDALLANQLARIFRPLLAEDVDLDDPDDRYRLQHLVIQAAAERWNITRNGRRVLTVATRQRAIRVVVAECNSAPLEQIDDAVVFHSSAAEFGHGVVLFPGVSNAGKSTLVAELMTRGHAYVTDEAAAVDVSSLIVRPFPKSICLEPGSQHLFPELRDRRVTAGLPVDDDSTWDVDPIYVGDGQVGAGGSIVGVVFPTFDADADPSFHPIEPIEALRLLLANAFDFDRVGQRAFAAMVRMANVLPCYVSTHEGGSAHLDRLELMCGSADFRRSRRP